MSVAEAEREWNLRATEILSEVAGRYGRTIEYGDLGAEVQRRAGILTDMPLAAWLDDVITEVARRCAEAGKPLLTLLVEDPDSKVDAVARMGVYEAYGAKMPGARKTATRSPRSRSRAAAAAERADRTPTKRTVKPEERRRPVCPSCFVELPSTGICDNCD
ncbi:MAG: hypothetical protein Q4G46_08565 [Propionibacteriaceae bacterium]|nr:hypothetical protein [Propionibacteriaceae bacterium]